VQCHNIEEANFFSTYLSRGLGLTILLKILDMYICRFHLHSHLEGILCCCMC